jgi:hypothetical protein
MICVIVRIDHSVDSVDSIRDELKSQLGRRVDQQSRATVRLDNSADAIPLVSRIR